MLYVIKKDVTISRGPFSQLGGGIRIHGDTMKHSAIMHQPHLKAHKDNPSNGNSSISIGYE